jgi:hypothetical protein
MRLALRPARFSPGLVDRFGFQPANPEEGESVLVEAESLPGLVGADRYADDSMPFDDRWSVELDERASRGLYAAAYRAESVPPLTWRFELPAGRYQPRARLFFAQSDPPGKIPILRWDVEQTAELE